MLSGLRKLQTSQPREYKNFFLKKWKDNVTKKKFLAIILNPHRAPY